MLACGTALRIGIVLFLIQLCFGDDTIQSFNFGPKPIKHSSQNTQDHSERSAHISSFDGKMPRSVRRPEDEPHRRTKRWYPWGSPWGYGWGFPLGYGGWGRPWGWSGWGFRPWGIGGYGYPYGIGWGYPYGIGMGYGLGGMGFYG